MAKKPAAPTVNAFDKANQDRLRAKAGKAPTSGASSVTRAALRPNPRALAAAVRLRLRTDPLTQTLSSVE